MSDTVRTIEIDSDAVERLVAAAERGQRVVLTRGGLPVAAVVAVDELRRLTDERELLRRLALGELESAASEGAELDAVLAECRRLVRDHRR